jgi:putative oxidoreductase
MKKLNHFFELRKAYGVIFLRLIVGWRLMAGAWNYVFQVKPISEVESFFTKLNLPAPLLSAYLSVYVQFICGLLFILGLWFRPAAIVMIINFTVAIIAAHLNDGIEKSFAAWVILAVSCFFLFNGAGKISIETRAKL